MNNSYIVSKRRTFLLAYSFRKIKYCISQSLSRTIKLLINRILLYLARIEGIYLGKLLNLLGLFGKHHREKERVKLMHHSTFCDSFHYHFFFFFNDFCTFDGLLSIVVSIKMYNYYEINVHYASHSMVDITLFYTSPS